MGHAVPLLVLGCVLEPEVGADVDRLHALGHQGNQGLGACGLRQGGERNIHAPGHLVLNHQVDVAQVGEGLAQLLANGAPAGDLSKLNLRVSMQDAGKLNAGVTSYVYDCSFQF